MRMRFPYNRPEMHAGSFNPPNASEDVMSTHEPIIDINPVAAVRDKTHDAAKKTADSDFQAPSFGKTAKSAAKAAKNAAPNVAKTAVIGKDGAAKKPSRIGGAVQTAVGGAIMLVGVPMLILPGPGLLAIGGGAVVAANGIKKVLGK